MNKERRAKINEVVTTLTECSSNLSAILDEESQSHQNSPENLSSSEQNEFSEKCIDTLEDAVSDIDDVVNSLQEIT